MTRRPRLLLDANVLVDAQVRDLLLRMAEAEVVEVRWSAELLDETERALRDDRGLSGRAVASLMSALRRAFPDAEVTGHDPLLARLDLPDPDDRHVVAAAVEAECDLIVTRNVRDFPDSVLEPWDLVALDIDDTLQVALDRAGDRTASIVERQ